MYQSFVPPLARSLRALFRAKAAGIALFLGSVAAVVPPAVAGDRIEDIASLDVLDGGWTTRGTYQAALRLRLAEGWKTYWRTPGDAGIPPHFRWSGTRNIAAMEITWPTPEVFLTSGLRTIGYHDEMVLPVEITPDRPNGAIRIKGRMELGLCREVCIPAEFSIDHKPDMAAKHNPVIAAALAERPFSAQEAGVRKAHCRLTPNEYGLTVQATIHMPSAGRQEIAVIEPGSNSLAVGETRSTRQGSTLVANADLFALSANTPLAVDRSALRITVLGDTHSVDIHGCSAG